MHLSFWHQFISSSKTFQDLELTNLFSRPLVKFTDLLLKGEAAQKHRHPYCSLQEETYRPVLFRPCPFSDVAGVLPLTAVMTLNDTRCAKFSLWLIVNLPFKRLINSCKRNLILYKKIKQYFFNIFTLIHRITDLNKHSVNIILQNIKSWKESWRIGGAIGHNINIKIKNFLFFVSEMSLLNKTVVYFPSNRNKSEQGQTSFHRRGNTFRHQH